MARSVASSRPGSVPAMNASAEATASWHALSQNSSTQVFITCENPASLPPIVMLTRLVRALSAASWPSRTPEVVAPSQATVVNEAVAWWRAHCAG